ncbi:hypothetical protein ACLBWC_29860, partial [Pseudomonas aeruginosa]
MSRRYWQLDVFAERPLTGNGLAVFDDASALDDAAMQAWTRELGQVAGPGLHGGGGGGKGPSGGQTR